MSWLMVMSLLSDQFPLKIGISMVITITLEQVDDHLQTLIMSWWTTAYHNWWWITNHDNKSMYFSFTSLLTSVHHKTTLLNHLLNSPWITISNLPVSQSWSDRAWRLATCYRTLFGGDQGWSWTVAFGAGCGSGWWWSWITAWWFQPLRKNS